ncbi:MAG: hypothetical protein V1834_03090 [Candidatus Micrarchaeota archaeon]
MVLPVMDPVYYGVIIAVLALAAFDYLSVDALFILIVGGLLIKYIPFSSEMFSASY